jgi:AcrR family transcriptional regulator
MGAGGRPSSKSDVPARRAQAQWRRQRLLDAALATFVDKGVDGATVKDITAAAGVTQGLLYHYFDGKDALVLAILQERGFLPELRRLLAGPRGRPAGVVLPELAAGFRRLLADHAELVALFFAASRANPAVRAGLYGFVAEGQQLLADYLAARVAAGELRPTTWRGRWSPASPDDRPGHESSGRVEVVHQPGRSFATRQRLGNQDRGASHGRGPGVTSSPCSAAAPPGGGAAGVQCFGRELPGCRLDSRVVGWGENLGRSQDDLSPCTI